MAYVTKIKYYSNVVCRICGQTYYSSSVQCRKYKASICMNHCLDCNSLIRPEWRCIYRKEDDRERRIDELYKKNGIQRKNAMLESTALSKNR